MAFEAYLDHRASRPTSGRRLTYAVSLIVHAAAIMAAVAYSFWHVEELTPPAVSVTFISAAAAPPPPPPPSPMGGGSAAARPKVAPRSKIEAAKVPRIVQPPVTAVTQPPLPAVPKEAPPEAKKGDSTPTGADNGAGVGTASGVKSGVANGARGQVQVKVGDGLVGGNGSAPSPSAQFLAPHLGTRQKLSGAEPDFPAHLAQAGTRYQLLAKICVTPSGAVETVTLLKRAHPTLDGNVLTAVKTWRFRPWLANGKAVPFCYPASFEFKSD